MRRGDGRITAEQVPSLLLGAIPSLADAWADAAVAHADPGAPTGRVDYLDAELAVEHLASRLARGETYGFDVVFDLIERLVVDGDPYVTELTVVGYLESMQMSPATSYGIDPEDFRPWLLPSSAEYWDALNDYWVRGAPFPSLPAG